MPRWSTATMPRPGQTIDGPAIIAERNATTVVEPGWRARMTALDHLVLERVAPREARHGDRHQRRPGDAGGVQQPVHEHRRADGAAAAEHRVLGEHQGAARLLLRPVRRRGQPDRQRAAHAGAPRLDGRSDQDGDRPQRREDAAGRRLRAERPVSRRHPPARRDRRHAGLRRPGRARQADLLRRLPRPPRRHRRHHARLDAALLDQHRGRGRADRQRQARLGRPLPRGGDARAAEERRLARRATPSRTSPT